MRISCPSLKMSAVTSNRSPTSRLTGYRPPSNSGRTRSMTMVARLSGKEASRFEAREPKVVGFSTGATDSECFKLMVTLAALGYGPLPDFGDPRIFLHPSHEDE